MYQTVMSKKGQVVIPKVIRDALGIAPYDQFRISIEKETIVMEPIPQTDDLFGAFNTKKSLDKKAVKQTVKNAVESKFKNK